MTSDLRLALRSLSRSPGFAATAILTLALAIGANSAVFSLVNGLLLAPPPYRDPGRLELVSLEARSPREPEPQLLPWSGPKLDVLTKTQKLYTDLAAFGDEEVALTGTGSPERIRVELVTTNYFSLLGLDAGAGRLLRPDDGAQVAVVGARLFHERFGGDRAVLGRTIGLNRVPLTIVGVAPDGFRGLTGDADVFVPLAAAPALTYPEALTEPWNLWLEVVGRVGEGRPSPAALASLADAVQRATPAPPGLTDGTTYGIASRPLAAARRDPRTARILLALQGAVGLVLLLACANVASLLLARAAGRERDVAIRLATGASRGRIVRLLLAESVLLTLAGGALGLVLASLGVRAVSALSPGALGGLRLDRIALDSRVVGVTLALSLATGLLFGLVPAVGAFRVRVNDALRGSAGDERNDRARRHGALVVFEVAIATALLVAAGLLVRTSMALSRVDPGFEPDGLLTMRLTPVSGDFTGKTFPTFVETLLSRVRTLPGVTAASVGNAVPLGDGGGLRTVVLRVDERRLEPASFVKTGIHFVGPDHLATLGARLVAGRGFTSADRAGSPRVALVSRKAASTFWPGQDPIGHRFTPGQGAFRDDETAEVVGVVGDVRYGRLDEEPGPAVYLAALQYCPPIATLMVRASVPPATLVPAIRREVAALSPDLPVSRVRSGAAAVGAARATHDLVARLLAGFALVAVGLAVLGIHGLVAYLVSRRTREIGLRMALGATRREVLGLFVGRMTRLALAGTVAGLVGAAAGSRLLASLLFGVDPGDPLTFAAAGVVLLLATLPAALLPARRALAVDPMTALRSE